MSSTCRRSRSASSFAHLFRVGLAGRYPQEEPILIGGKGVVSRTIGPSRLSHTPPREHGQGEARGHTTSGRQPGDAGRECASARRTVADSSTPALPRRASLAGLDGHDVQFLSERLLGGGRGGGSWPSAGRRNRWPLRCGRVTTKWLGRRKETYTTSRVRYVAHLGRWLPNVPSRCHRDLPGLPIGGAYRTISSTSCHEKNMVPRTRGTSSLSPREILPRLTKQTCPLADR